VLKVSQYYNYCKENENQADADERRCTFIISAILFSAANIIFEAN